MEQAASQSICSIGLVEGTEAGCRRVTPAADSVSLTDGPAASMPTSAASAAMAVRAARWGLVTPPSQRLTVAKETPSRSASCSCVRSRTGADGLESGRNSLNFCHICLCHKCSITYWPTREKNPTSASPASVFVPKKSGLLQQEVAGSNDSSPFELPWIYPPLP